MDEPLTRHLQRWRDAEDQDLDDQADALFAEVFRVSVRTETPAPRFAASTMAAVRVAVERDTARARRMRLVAVPVCVLTLAASAYFGGGLAVRVLSWMVVASLDLVIGAVVAMAASIPAGADVWTIMTTLGRAAAALLTTPAVTVTILAIQGIAIAAFVALQRILRSDGELLR